jgi:hypothetical protein
MDVLYKLQNISRSSMTQPANGMYSRVLHGICVVTAITHAPPRVMYVMHFMNMLTRLLLLCLGIALFSTRSHSCVSGLVIQQYNSAAWDATTHTDWIQDTLPRMQAVVGPGNIVVMALWFTTIICFFINDTLRCALVFTGKWYTRENHMDMSWSTLSCSGIPLLFTCVAVQLGTREMFMLGVITFITIVSGVCGAITEHLRTMVNPYTMDGMSENVLWILRVTQDLSLIICSQLVTIPIYFSSMNNDSHVIHSDVVLVILFTGLTYGFTIASYRHHRLCSIFEETWPTRCSMLPWGAVHTEYTASSNASVTPSMVSEQSSLGKLGGSDTAFYPSNYAVTGIPFYGNKTSGDKIGSVKTLTTTDDSGDVETSETSEERFNKLYGCHLWKSDSADIVHIVDQDHRVITVELTEDFNMYNQIHEPVSISRCGVLSRGLHIAQMGAAPQLFHTYIDECGINTRRMIGLLTEWRRYYLINMFVDAILFTTLLDMTGVIGCSNL